MSVIKFIIAASVLLITLTGPVSAGSYEKEVSGWKSYKDVASWLEDNFSFDRSRQKQIIKRLKQEGPEGLLARDPANLFENSEGYCVDSSNFAIDALNRIDSSYNARWVFIWNDKGPPNHWVTAFDYEGKLYIMDYGAGPKWNAMRGVHGPYTSLEDYRDFLASLDLPKFEVGEVKFRDMPGMED